MRGAEILAMTQGRSCNPVSQLVPFPVIKAAVTGDAEAVSKILNHYDRYITKLSLESASDDTSSTGGPHLVVNQDLKDCLQAKLMWCVVMRFKMY